MAIIDFKETWVGRTGDQSDLAVRNYRRTWDAYTDSITDDQIDVLNHPDLPRLFDPFTKTGETRPLDSTSLLQHLNATVEPDNAFLWHITGDYSTEVTDKDLFALEPLLRPADITYDAADDKYVANVDLNGKPFISSAWDPFDPPVELELATGSLTIERNERAFNQKAAELFESQCLNSVKFWGRDPLFVRFARLRQVRQFEAGQRFWRTTYEFHIRPPGFPWTDIYKIQNRGMRQRIWTGELQVQGPNVFRIYKFLPCVDAKGMPVTAPALLDEDGKQLPLLATAPSPTYTQFRGFSSIDFAGELKLPNGPVP